MPQHVAQVLAQGTLSVSGAKFINWRQDVGGGGAIDLVMHLAELDFAAAVVWLEDHLAGGFAGETAAACAATAARRISAADGQPPTLRLGMGGLSTMISPVRSSG